MMKNGILFTVILFFTSLVSNAQTSKNSKPISPDLLGIFFEDISYAADGGLYAELVQNRSFEYNPSDRQEWTPFTAWEYVTKGFGYGTVSIETSTPVHANNPHYLLLNVEEAGEQGVGISNKGFDGIVIKAGDKYDCSVFVKQLSDKAVPLVAQLRNNKDEILGEASFSTDTKEWKKYSVVLEANKNDDSCSLVILAKTKARLALDLISLFPQKTYKGRANGLRADLAEAIAGLQPKFMRFPGGCLVHGDGLGNMYRWKNTIGPLEQRVEQRNIWSYHQTTGLGYYEYFQFCEDIGAKPLPVVPAAVSCQNSGGTWRIGGTGQKAIPLDELDEYIQEINDLIEWANGPASSEWGAKRLAAGHPLPFNLQYVGVGNEDKITPEFKERFTIIYNAIKAKHPEITIVGTSGPGSDGDDYDKGWELANQLKVPMIDEHYYRSPKWFLANNRRYDTYNRSQSKVYVGEYASWGNTLFNALAEAAYLTSLERNGDVVSLASYAPLLANQAHTSWNPNLIYFTNNSMTPTVNYYVQQLFSVHHGDTYYSDIISFTERKDSTLAASCVRDSKSGDIILKIVNAGSEKATFSTSLAAFKNIQNEAQLYLLTGAPDAKNTQAAPTSVLPIASSYKVSKKFVYEAPPYSLSVIRIKAKK